MNPQFAIALFGVFTSLAAFLAFTWAIARGQLRASESAKFALLDDEPSADVFAPAPSPRRARGLVAAIALVFLFIAGCTTLTILTAAHASRPTSGKTAGSASKCPF